MADEIELQVARVVDREALLETLRARGVEAEPLDGDDVLGVRIPCGEGESERACEELLAQMEALVADSALPLVPQRGEGFVFLRPPGD